MESEELINQYKDLMHEKNVYDDVDKVIDEALKQSDETRIFLKKSSEQAEKNNDIDKMISINKEMGENGDFILSLSQKREELNAQIDKFNERMDMFKTVVEGSGMTLTELEKLMKENG